MLGPVALTAIAISVSLAQTPESPVTGPAVAGMVSFDRLLPALMQNWHAGVQAGVAALPVHYPSVRAVAVLLNSRPKDSAFDGELANAVLQALVQSKE